MKLAEALQERADLNARIEQLRARLSNNCMVQEGEKPQEDPDSLLDELNRCIDRLQYLMAAVNRTNAATLIEGETITSLIARKDCMQLRLSAWRDLANRASQVTQRARSSEIRIVPVVDVPSLQRRIDSQSKALRLLDNRLQAANWSVDLVEN